MGRPEFLEHPIPDEFFTYCNLIVKILRKGTSFIWFTEK